MRYLHLVAPCLGFLTACGGAVEAGAGASDPREEEKPRAPTVEEQLEHLAMLGYVGFSEEEDGSAAGVEFTDAASFMPGYGLVSCIGVGVVDLVDKRGELVHSWSVAGSRQLDRARMLPTGDLLVISLQVGDEGDEGAWSLMRLGWDGTVHWSRAIGAHHDAWLVPPDRVAVLTFEHRTDVDLKDGLPLRDEHVTLLSLDGEVLERHSFWDIVSQDQRVLTRMHNRFFRRGGLKSEPFWDFFHANSVEWFTQERAVRLMDSIRPGLYRTGNVLVSFRMQDMVAIIDPRAQRVLWHWGRGQIEGPHEARLLENGNVLLFDNGCWGRDHSRLVEVDPRTDEIVWTYTAPVPQKFFSKTRGVVQPLPEGHRFVVDSNRGVAFEVDADGTEVWRYRTPRTNDAGHRSSIRMEHLAPELVENVLKSR